MLTIEKLQEIHQIAFDAVKDKSDHGACGFAWVNVYGIRKKADKAPLQAFGFSRNEYEKAQQLWVGHFGQSIDAKEDYAHAFAGELQKLGYRAYSGSRLD